MIVTYMYIHVDSGVSAQKDIQVLSDSGYSALFMQKGDFPEKKMKGISVTNLCLL